MKILTAAEMRAIGIAKPWTGFSNIVAPLSRSPERMTDAIMAKPAPRVAPFTPAEDEAIRKLHGIGCSSRQIAEVLSRPGQSVLDRAKRLGIVFGKLRRARVADALVKAALSEGAGR